MKTWKEFIDYIEAKIPQYREEDPTFDESNIMDFDDGWQVEITSLISDEGHISGFTIYRWNCEILDCLVNWPTADIMEVVFIHWIDDPEAGTNRFFGVIPADFDVRCIMNQEDSFDMIDDMIEWIHSL